MTYSIWRRTQKNDTSLVHCHCQPKIVQVFDLFLYAQCHGVHRPWSLRWWTPLVSLTSAAIVFICCLIVWFIGEMSDSSQGFVHSSNAKWLLICSTDIFRKCPLAEADPRAMWRGDQSSGECLIRSNTNLLTNTHSSRLCFQIVWAGT